MELQFPPSPEGAPGAAPRTGKPRGAGHGGRTGARAGGEASSPAPHQLSAGERLGLALPGAGETPC
jgi:hypothetical protein